MRLLVNVYKTIELDNYKNGCNPETTQDFGEIDSFTCSKQDLFKDIEKHLGFVKSNIEPFENRLETSQLENVNGNIPTDHQLEKFKRNELELYHAGYSIYVSEVRTKNINDMENYIKGL